MSSKSAAVARQYGELAIRVSDVSKSYQIYDKPQHRLLQSLLHGRRKLYRDYWALRNISFDVKRGETVGIIGRNGSGKSTLLQIISGTLTPSAGNVDVSGRITALLELGAGFHPDFTGRENAYMNAMLLGFASREIGEQMGKIAAFADIGDFFDQPVKTYSSGMYVRLGFSVAISLSPDILVVDEALAVGDMVFQAKCMREIRKLMASGVTVLFVSHDIGAVKALCNRCLYLDGGTVRAWGNAREVTSLYISQSHLAMNVALKTVPISQEDTSAHRPPTAASPDGTLIKVQTTAARDIGKDVHRYGDGRVTILDVRLLDERGQPADELELDQPFELQISVRVNEDLPDFAWGYSFRDLKGQMLVAMMSTADVAANIGPVRQGETFVLGIQGHNALVPGVYTVSIGVELPVVLNRQHVFLQVLENAAVFRSIPPADTRGMSPGLVKLPVAFQVLARCE